MSGGWPIVNVALLGGSFDPPHLAHQMACLYLLEGESFAEVWLLPCYRHAFGKALAPFEDRLEMCRRLARPFGGRVAVVEIERELPGGEGVNRTVDTMEALRAQHPDVRLTFAVGSDIPAQAPAWKDFERLKTMVDFLVLRRPGYAEELSGWRYAPVALPDISSTQVRERIRRGESVQGLVPAAVADFIEERQLYRA